MARPIMTALALLALGAAAVSAGGFDSGDVVNGDFEDGDTGWAFTVPTTNWEAEVQATGGNPDGGVYMRSPFFEDPGSTVCVEQDFICGSGAGGTGCQFTLDYYLQTLDAGVNSGRLQVFLDDEMIYETPDADVIDWSTLEFSTDCGPHVIRMCLDVDPGNHSWIARFDNVGAACMMPVPVEPRTWGQVKAEYR